MAEGMCLSPLEFAAMRCLLRNAAGIRAPSGPNISERAVGVGILPDVIVQFVGNHVEFGPDELEAFGAKFCSLVDEMAEPVGMDLSPNEVDAISLAVTVVHGMPAHPPYSAMIRTGDIAGIASFALREGTLTTMQHVADAAEQSAWERKVALILAHLRVHPEAGRQLFEQEEVA